MLSAREQGAAPPPPGIVPNFADPPNQNTETIAVCSVCIAISTFFIAARTYTRLALIKRHGWEDYLLWLAWLLSIAYSLMLPLGIPYKIGVHQWNVTQSTYSQFAERANIGEIFYDPVACMLKVAILVQIIHIFVIGKDKLYWVVVGHIVLAVCFYTAVTLARIFACTPRQKIWDPDVPGTCTNGGAAIVSSAVVNVVLDFSILMIPLVKTWHLQTEMNRKIAVLAIFGTGLFCCVASIMRLVVSVTLLLEGDSTFNLLFVGLWSTAEITAGIVCACLPVLPLLYRRIAARLPNPFITVSSARANAGTYYSAGRIGRTTSNKERDSIRTQKPKNSYVEIDEGTQKSGRISSTEIHAGHEVLPPHNYAAAATRRNSHQELELGQIRATTVFGMQTYEPR